MRSLERLPGPESATTLAEQPSDQVEFVVQHAFGLPGLSLDEVFELFSDPGRLNDVTPSWFGLYVRTPYSWPLRVGARLDYRMKWRGLRMSWRSVITEVEPPHWLVYEQCRGPFREFRHEHSFVSKEDIVFVTDRIAFRVFGGRWAARVLAAPDLRRILRYRESAAKRILLGNRGTASRAL